MNRICTLYAQGDVRIEAGELAQPDAFSVLIEVRRGGICGSDLHYYHEGGIGTIKVMEPIILGHEISGVVREAGASVTGIKAGDRVVINPARPCGSCPYCAAGHHQHCAHMRFMGSAKTRPHVQGGFRDAIVVDASQCHQVADHIGFAEAACTEPLAVCLHALKQADDLKGQRVLITGAGPIGALCVALAARAGARDIVVTDLAGFALNIARKMGATHAINVEEAPERLAGDVAQNGCFDIAFECSAAAPAIKAAMEFVKPRGTIIQLGSAGDTIIPLNVLVGREIALKGTMRFHAEFAEAVVLVNTGGIDVSPLVTHSFPLEDVEQALKTAADRSRAMKVQLELGRGP